MLLVLILHSSSLNWRCWPHALLVSLAAICLVSVWLELVSVIGPMMSDLQFNQTGLLWNHGIVHWCVHNRSQRVLPIISLDLTIGETWRQLSSLLCSLVHEQDHWVIPGDVCEQDFYKSEVVLSLPVTHAAKFLFPFQFASCFQFPDFHVALSSLSQELA